MPDESGSYTGPYPTEAPAEPASGLEGPGPLPEGGTDQSATTAPPSVNTEGHSELETASPSPSGAENQSATGAPPTLAASLGSSPGPTAGGLAGAGLGAGEAAAGSTASVAVAAATAKGASGIADPELGKGPLETSPSRTGALPEVAATPNPLSYGHLGTS